MKKKINVISLGIFILILVIYVIGIIFGFQPVFQLQKVTVLFLLLVLVINIGMYIYEIIRDNKILNIIISFQIELALFIVFILIFKNMNVNIYKVEKGNKNYLMKVNVNDNSKEYYLLKNPLIITRNYAIKEYLSDTDLSYEENTPTRIEYNKEILKNGINQRVVVAQKKIISSDKLIKGNDRIIKYISNYSDMNVFCQEFDIANNYSEEYFKNKDIICISYIPFKEVIPFITFTEDNKYYIYLKDDIEEKKDEIAFCFIEIDEKNNIDGIELLDYNETIKNKNIE